MANCSVFWNNFSGDTPDWLMQFFVFYCIAVCFLGLLCNVVALWCVAGCPKRRLAVKVLLCALFSCTFLLCLLVMPFMAHVAMSKLWCDLQVNMWVIQGFLFVYVILTEMELFFILVMAFLKAIAVWSPKRHQVKLRTSVALVVGVAFYCTATTAALMVPYWVDVVSESTGIKIALVMNVLHFFLPMVLTLACYSSILLAVRRNKRRLAAIPDTAVTGQVMDHATRAMLAVVISNLLLGLQHSLYHILPYAVHVTEYVSVHIVFFTHLFVDPLVFVCFNLHHRQRVLQALKSCLHSVTCKPSSALPRATSTLPLHLNSSSTSSKTSQKNHS